MTLFTRVACACAMLLGLVCAAEAAPAATPAPAADWLAIGDVLLGSGGVWDALDAYAEAARTVDSPALQLRLALVFALQPDRCRQALPYALLATNDPRDRGSRELVAWLATGSPDGVAAAEEALLLLPRSPIERAAAMLGAIRRRGPLFDLLVVWPASVDGAFGVGRVPPVDPAELLASVTRDERGREPEPLPAVSALETAPAPDWTVGLLPPGEPRTLPTAGPGRARVFELAARHLRAGQQREAAAAVALAGMEACTGAAAAPLALELALARESDPAARERCLEQSLRLDPANPRALLQQATWRLAEHRVAEAIRALERLLAVEPRNPAAMERLASALLQPGQDSKRALKWARLAADCKPSTPGRLRLLSQALAASGHSPEESRLSLLQAAVEACQEMLWQTHGEGFRKSFSFGPDETLLGYLAGRAEMTILSIVGTPDAPFLPALRRRGEWLAPIAALAHARACFLRGRFEECLRSTARAAAAPLAEVAYWSTLCDSHLMAAAAHQALGDGSASERELAEAMEVASRQGEPMRSRAAVEIARFRRLVREGGPLPPLSVEINAGVEVQALRTGVDDHDFGEASVALARFLLEMGQAVEALGILRAPRSHSVDSVLLRARAEWLAGDARLAAVALLAAREQGPVPEEYAALGRELLAHLEDPTGRREVSVPGRRASTGTEVEQAFEWLGRGEPAEAARLLESQPDASTPVPELLEVARAWEQLGLLRRRLGAPEGTARAMVRAAACALAAGKVSRARHYCASAGYVPLDLTRRLRERFTSGRQTASVRPGGLALILVAPLFCLLALRGFGRLSGWLAPE